MEKLRIISIVNFVRGGKSSIARLLAEHLNTSILNFDPQRNSEYYNAVKTNNIPINSKIERLENKLMIETTSKIIDISSSSNMFICDFGGRFDERIKEFESDLYIVPTMDDFESISETAQATHYILKHNPNAKIIHILNMAMCISKSEKNDFINGYFENMKQNKISVPYLIMPRSNLLKKMINSGKKTNDIIDTKISEKNYKSINAFVRDLIFKIKEISC
ncbi:hypothetical protein ACOAK2_12180 (plasmid) [Aliarcobacter butzleri]|uniref:hypothetical protein n=1 Tax=Aliarcobacter butzleri TaxID=28197 RepID=UPI003B283838